MRDATDPTIGGRPRKRKGAQKLRKGGLQKEVQDGNPARSSEKQHRGRRREDRKHTQKIDFVRKDFSKSPLRQKKRGGEKRVEDRHEKRRTV